MVAPFNQAWMLLKQRGHELNLPPQSAGIKGMGSPQDLTDRRVDEATMARRALDEFERLNSMRHPTFSNAREATNELGRRREVTDEMKNQRNHASISEGNERFLQEGQSELDQAILARMGQQPEADEMEAMGVPPMSRTLGGTPPANLGRAGSSGRPPVGSDDLSDGLIEHRPHFADSYTNLLNQYGPLDNPFPSPVGLNVRDDLMDWAAGAGREAGKPDIVERTENPYYDLSEMHDSDMYDEMHSEPLHENNPAKHSIASTTLRASPRQQRRGQMDSGRPYFKKPDREGPIGTSPSQRMIQQMQQMNAGKEIGF